MKRLRRNKKGNQMAEFGPAVFILVCMILIPMMVLIYVGLGFACGWYLNFMCTRACAVVPAADMPTALNAQQAAWFNSGLPNFTGASIVSNTATRVAFINTNGAQALTSRGKVHVVTVVKIQPFVSIPLLPLGPFTFTYVGERPIEDFSLEGAQS